MMTQQTSFSILTAPLAVDRRALSQAWYSALHLANKQQPASPSARKLPEISFHDRTTRNVVREQARERGTISDVRALPSRRGGERVVEIADRRANRSPLARKIERAFLNPRRPVSRATFAVEGTHARVHISLQTIGNRVRVVAVCPTNARAAVADALAQVRFALAARGINVTIEGHDAC